MKDKKTLKADSHWEFWASSSLSLNDSVPLIYAYKNVNVQSQNKLDISHLKKKKNLVYHIINDETVVTSHNNKIKSSIGVASEMQ